MKKILPLVALFSMTTLVSSHAAESTNTNTLSARQSASLQQANAQEFFRASTLVGKRAQDSKGTKVGDIKDVAFNQQGHMFVFVDVDNGKWAVVPWQAIRPETAKGKDNVTLNASAQQLKAGPAVTENQWGSLNNPEFVQACYSYYHLQPPAAMGAASTPGGSSQGQGSSQQTTTNQPSSP